MATIEFKAYQIHEVHKFRSEVTGEEAVTVSFSFGIGRPAPFETERIQAKSLKEIIPAFDAYVERAKETGLQLQLRARVSSGRSPAGFEKARKNNELIRNVNI